MSEFELTITTPKRQLFKGRVESVNLPSQEGHMSILAGHAPLLANLAKGKIIIITSADKREFDIAGGFVEVDEKGVTVLAKEPAP